ncbi:hypothetical protein GWK47_034297 [Chionoecetes opilio]|uniref:Uncharacterized protein n=1 Tax=Chionoecetes opilio TaxID=41210 RepID=A0A8J4YP49_CHIOP|nr:hypothetical protein GWK47_034297 [Chionoecetes opilio]
MSEPKTIPRNQLENLRKSELIDIILTMKDDDEGSASISKILNEVIEELDMIKKLVVSPVSVINKKMDALEVEIGKQAEIIFKQQLYLEAPYRKERRANVVILGVPDEQEYLSGAVNDADKLNKVWEILGVNNVAGAHRRLGGTAQGGTNRRCRPILLMLQDESQRQHILEQAKKLKNAGEAFKKIYVKKDIHPAVRKEWKRLHDAERTEKERAGNVGCVIHFNTR